MANFLKKVRIFFVVSFLSVILFLSAFHYFRTQKSKASTTDTGIYNPQLQQYQVEVDASLSKVEPKTEVLIFLQKPELQKRVTSTEQPVREEEQKQSIEELMTKTTIIQQKILPTLQSLIDNNHLIIKKTFFIDNIIYAQVDDEAINNLKTMPGIIKVIPNFQTQLPPLTQTTESVIPEWNLSKIGADRVWNELGVTGQGITVGNIDTGVQWDHPALKGKYRGFDGVNTDNNYNWFDPTQISPSIPLDDSGHGTHTMGIIVGSDGSNLIGVAPGAKWIAAKGCDASGNCTASNLITAGQWMLAPTKVDGSEPDPTKAPRIINNSWGGPGCSNWYQGVVQSWKNAGIIPIFSAGNSGPNSGTIGSPGDYPESYSVGATDVSDYVASFSSRGPPCSTFGGPHETKPDISAPGVGIKSSIPNNSYMTVNGTSMAAPHVSGLAALILQARPNLLPDDVLNIIGSSASDLGLGGLDNNYGYGLINAYKALTSVPSPTAFPTVSPPYPIKQIQVIQPNGTEQLTKGQQYQIKWSSQNVDQVMIDIIDGNGDFSTISLPLAASTGEYLWTVPTSWYGTSNAYKIKIYEYPSKVAFDMSDVYFYIISPTPTPTTAPIAVVFPNGGEILEKNKIYQIKWNMIGDVQYVDLELTKDTGTVIQKIAEVNSPTTSYSWNAYSGYSDSQKLKIKLSAHLFSNPWGNPIVDFSDGSFTIYSPPTPTINPSPTPTNTPTPTPTNTPSPTPTNTPIPTLTNTPTPTKTPTPTYIPRNTPTPTPIPQQCPVCFIKFGGRCFLSISMPCKEY